ncbi:MAG: hypothetical protein ACJA0J_000539 [Bdellovibrionota bacterium]|jgi:hypothetical protein
MDNFLEIIDTKRLLYFRLVKNHGLYPPKPWRIVFYVRIDPTLRHDDTPYPIVSLCTNASFCSPRPEYPRRNLGGLYDRRRYLF